MASRAVKSKDYRHKAQARRGSWVNLCTTTRTVTTVAPYEQCQLTAKADMDGTGGYSVTLLVSIGIRNGTFSTPHTYTSSKHAAFVFLSTFVTRRANDAPVVTYTICMETTCSFAWHWLRAGVRQWRYRLASGITRRVGCFSPTRSHRRS